MSMAVTSFCMLALSPVQDRASVPTLAGREFIDLAVIMGAMNKEGTLFSSSK